MWVTYSKFLPAQCENVTPVILQLKKGELEEFTWDWEAKTNQSPFRSAQCQTLYSGRGFLSTQKMR